MKRYSGNPILKPIVEHSWESRMVFNAATVYHDGKVHILYRAVGDDKVSRLGYASTSDGYNIDERLPKPVFEPSGSFEREGCEDPRLTPMGNEYIMTYTALRERVPSSFQIALTSISSEDLASKRWNWGERSLPFPGVRDKNAVMFPKKIDGEYVMFHRIEPSICVAYSEDLRRWHGIKSVMDPRRGEWDCLKIGAAGPPMETEEGWLFIYHGVDYDKIYRLGVALLDRGDPEEVIYRSPEPILKPQEPYERHGSVPHVVFSCGSVILDDKLFLYYGGADTVLCVATIELGELIRR